MSARTLLILGLLQAAQAAVADTAGPVATTPLPASAIIAQLQPLPPLAQLEKIRELAGTSAAARNLAALLAKPGLLTLHRQELERVLGGREPVIALATLSAKLHVEARADERVMAGLQSLAQQLSPEGRLPMLELSSWYDGATASVVSPAPASYEPSALGGAQLSAVLAWTVGEPSEPRRRVHTMTSQDGQLLINGKPAQPFLPKRNDGGVIKEAFLHPSDSGVLIKVYHSAASLDGFEQKNARVENLAPMSMAGAAPRLIEHGEAAVDGKGRVYFYAQELVQGPRLIDLPPEARPLDEVRKLFDRLIKAGLALIVPGPDQGWLLSHIMIGNTASGGAGAYILNGGVEAAEPQSLPAHYDMLLSVLDPASSAPQPEKPAAATPPPAEPAAEPAKPQAPTIPLPVDKLETLPEAADRKLLLVAAAGGAPLAEVLARHGLSGALTESASPAASQALRFNNEQAAASAAAELLSEPDIARIKAHPAVKEAIEQRGVKDLYAILAAIPESNERDALILRIPGSAYASSESRHVAAILSLFTSGQLGNTYPKVPAQAWRGMNRHDLEHIVRVWSSSSFGATIATLWAKAVAQNPVGEPGGLWRDLRYILELLPEGYRAGVVTPLWVALTERTSGQDVLDLVKSVPESAERDALILKIPKPIYAAMGSAAAADLLSLVSTGGDYNNGTVYNNVPAEAWLAVSRQDAKRLVGRWVTINYQGTTNAVIRLWLTAHYQGRESATGAALRDFQELLGILPQNWRASLLYSPVWLVANKDATPKDLYASLQSLGESSARDGLILQIPEPAYAKMESADVGAILSLVSREGERTYGNVYNRIPPAAWSRLDVTGAAELIKQWVFAYNTPGTANVIIPLWMKAHYATPDPSKPDSAWKELMQLFMLLPENWRANGVAHDIWQLANRSAAAKDLYDRLRAQAESNNRDALIAALPASAYAAMESPEIALLLSLVTRQNDGVATNIYAKIPEEAWRLLGRADVETLLRQRLAVSNTGSANTILQLWMKAHHQGQREEDGAAWKDLEALMTLLPEGYRASIVTALWVSIIHNASGQGLSEDLKWIGESNARDGMIFQIPSSSYKRMDSGEIASILGLISNGAAYSTSGAVYAKIPEDAWLGMRAEDVKLLMGLWQAKGYGPTAVFIQSQWLNAQQPHLADDPSRVGGYADMLKLVAQPQRDQRISGISGATYGKLASPDVARIISYVHPGSLAALPEEAWKRLRMVDRDWLIGANPDASWATSILGSWMRSRGGGPALQAGQDLAAALKLLPASAQRDEVILGIPGSAYVAMESADIADILALLGADGKAEGAAAALAKVPEEAWYRLSREGVEAVIKRWAGAADGQKAAAAAMSLWLGARQP